MEQNLRSKMLRDADELQCRLIAYLNKTGQLPTASVGSNTSSGDFEQIPMASCTGLKPLEPNAELKKPIVLDATYTEYGGLNAGPSPKANRRSFARLRDHQQLYISIRETDLDTLLENIKRGLKFASIRKSLVYQGGFYGQWSVMVMRRIQDKFNFSIDNIRSIQSILRSSTLPLDVPLKKQRDITRELAGQLDWALIEELLCHTLYTGKSSIKSASFRRFSYDPKSLPSEIQSCDFTVIDHSAVGFGYYSECLSPPSPPEVPSSPDSYHPSEFCPEGPLWSDPCDRPIPERYFDEACEPRPHSRSLSPFHLLPDRISQVSSPRDEGYDPPEQCLASRDQHKSRRQCRKRRLSNSGSEPSTSRSPVGASLKALRPDDHASEANLSLVERVHAVRKKVTVLQAQLNLQAGFASTELTNPISPMTPALFYHANSHTVSTMPGSSNSQVAPSRSFLNMPMTQPKDAIIKELGLSSGFDIESQNVGPSFTAPSTNTKTTLNFVPPHPGSVPPLNHSRLIDKQIPITACQVPHLAPTFDVPVLPKSQPISCISSTRLVENICPNVAMPAGETNHAKIAVLNGSRSLPEVSGLRIDPADHCTVVSSVLPLDNTVLKPIPRHPQESHVLKGGITLSMNWFGSAEETMQRFMPKTSQETFDYVGFFIECFHRMSAEFRADLKYVALLVSSILTTENIKMNEPEYQSLTDIWRASVAVNRKLFIGSGRLVNSAILNTLGLAFPEKVSALHKFAREQGFLGWKLARKQYGAISGDIKYNALRAKLWTELNKVFFLKSSSTEYYQRDVGEVVKEKLNQAMSVVLVDMSLLVCTGPVCVDVQATFKDGDNSQIFTGTHFSVGSASLALISSMFNVSLQMKFLDDIMLLLGEGCLKRTSHNQMVTDFYWDLLLARTDFLSALCQTCTNLDAVVKRLVSGSIGEQYAKVLECLVADDGFYYGLLGWMFGQTLGPESSHTHFFKMWSVSRIRLARIINLSQILNQRSKSDALSKSRELKLLQSISKNFADQNIFIWKVSQSSYACHMIESMLSKPSLNDQLYHDLMHFACKAEDHIGIEPYTPLCAKALLGNDARPLIYEDVTSITGLILDQAKCEKRAAFIRSICRDTNSTKLAAIIRLSVSPNLFEALLDTASRDILYIPAIEQLAASPTTSMGYIEQHKWWHVGFWQNLGRDAAEMPDLRCLPEFVKCGLKRVIAPTPAIPVLKNNGKDPSRQTAQKSFSLTNLREMPEKMKHTQHVNSADTEASKLMSVLSVPPNDKKELVHAASIGISTTEPNLVHDWQMLSDLLKLMGQQNIRGPAHELILSTPGWSESLKLAINDGELGHLLKEVITCTDDTAPIFLLFAKRWKSFQSVLNLKATQPKPVALLSIPCSSGPVESVLNLKATQTKPVALLSIPCSSGPVQSVLNLKATQTKPVALLSIPCSSDPVQLFSNLGH